MNVDFNMSEDGVATGVASYSRSNQSCDPQFKIDRPFGLAIVDRTTQTILGIGQMLHMEGENIEKQ